MLHTFILVIFLVFFCAQSSVFTSVCIGRIREAPCLFDFHLRELVPEPDSIIPTEFQKYRSNIASVYAANSERIGWNIGCEAKSRRKIF